MSEVCTKKLQVAAPNEDHQKYCWRIYGRNVCNYWLCQESNTKGSCDVPLQGRKSLPLRFQQTHPSPSPHKVGLCNENVGMPAIRRLGSRIDNTSTGHRTKGRKRMDHEFQPPTSARLGDVWGCCAYASQDELVSILQWHQNNARHNPGKWISAQSNTMPAVVHAALHLQHRHSLVGPHFITGCHAGLYNATFPFLWQPKGMQYTIAGPKILKFKAIIFDL